MVRALIERRSSRRVRRLGRRSLALGSALALCLSLGAGGAAARTDRAASGITVFAAASLTQAFPVLAPGNTYSFAGSNTLAAQIANGAPADVFASANTSIPAALYAKGLIEKPVDFTRNTLVLVVPKSNPAGIQSIYDLARPGVSIDIANPSVPVGGYTLQVWNQMGLTASLMPNVVSQEVDVTSVLAKIAHGPGRRRLRLLDGCPDRPRPGHRDRPPGLGPAEGRLRDGHRHEQPESGGGAGVRRPRAERLGASDDAQVRVPAARGAGAGDLPGGAREGHGRCRG